MPALHRAAAAWCQEHGLADDAVRHALAAGSVRGLAEPLTERELEVLRLIAAGRSNQRIAHDLVVALDTVKKHVAHVLGRLGAANRTEAAALAALTCVVLYRGAERAGLARGRAALLAGAAAVLFGGWLTASAVIAEHGWFRTLPWFPVAVTGYLALLLALGRIPVVARALTAPGALSRLELPHAPRVAGVIFLLYLALGQLHLTSLSELARAARAARPATRPLTAARR